MIVTAVERQARRRRVNVFVDGHFALALSADLAAERGVRPGRAVTPDELSTLARAEAQRAALQSGLLLLAYRPRSERELRDRLARKGFGGEAVDQAIARLRALGYLDDAAFARFWTETRQALRPRSRRVLVGELRRRGVGAETAQEAAAGVSDLDAAYEAASRRLRHLRNLEHRVFRERLGRFLTSRGFPYDVSRRVIERCWAELSEETSTEAARPP